MAASPIHARRRRTNGKVSIASITASTGMIGFIIFQPSNRLVEGGTDADTETLIVKELGAVVVGAEQLPFGTVVVQVKHVGQRVLDLNARTAVRPCGIVGVVQRVRDR